MMSTDGTTRLARIVIHERDGAFVVSRMLPGDVNEIDIHWPNGIVSRSRWVPRGAR